MLAVFVGFMRVFQLQRAGATLELQGQGLMWRACHRSTSLGDTGFSTAAPGLKWEFVLSSGARPTAVC